IQREEKSVQKAIRDAAKRNDMGSAKALAKEIVRSRQTVERLYQNKAQLNSISMHLGESVGRNGTCGHLSGVPGQTFTILLLGSQFQFLRPRV
ncbi:hypothetical protein U1Q18_030337, partial [Sarracenia purpurea var. burkii]